MQDIKFIAVYLPQFHPIPENDEWWGKGFTEWTNVTKAIPLFKGHYQPKLPADLGFYDLRNKETRNQQAALAKDYGIEGFAYYHYWFKGKRLIERPFNEVLECGDPDFPFCLIWANETWSRRWLGEEYNILIKQEYSKDDDAEHARFLAKAFSDRRYITKDGRPIFTIYRPNDLPDVESTITIIKEVSFKNLKIEPFIVASNSHTQISDRLLERGFDGILNFRPQLGVLSNAFKDEFVKERLIENIKRFRVLSGIYKIYDYENALNLMKNIEPTTFDNVIPSVFVGWDNTARRDKHGIIIKDNYPHLFEKELIRVKRKLGKADVNLGFIFVNAWNEWAEGNYLEPDRINKYGYLEAVKNAVNNNEC
jgi:lipopolysaccharide biosynthesis protein